jgi:hypothetical protein
MARAGYFAPGEQGHHWLIPQNGWGKYVPDAIKNHPINIKPLPKDVHKRIHSADRVNGLPRYNPVERLVHGTPTWVKGDAAVSAAHVAAGARDKDR